MACQSPAVHLNLLSNSIGTMSNFFVSSSWPRRNTSAEALDKIVFDESALPATVIILDANWRLSITSSPVLQQLFSFNFVEAVARGEPQAAEQVFSLLSHWITEGRNDNAVRHTYALRLRMDAYIYKYALARQVVDLHAWNMLGVCSVGREVALRLDANLSLNRSSPWQILVLWDWIELKEAGSVSCTFNINGSRLNVLIQQSMLNKAMIVFPLTGAYLWPVTYPVIDANMLHARIAAGEMIGQIVDTLIAAK